MFCSSEICDSAMYPAFIKLVFLPWSSTSKPAGASISYIILLMSDPHSPCGVSPDAKRTVRINLKSLKPGGFRLTCQTTGATRRTYWESIGEGKMGGISIYRVVFDSSHSEGRYQREFIGPAASGDEAVEQARTVFKERLDDRLVTVEAVDLESWTEDMVLPLTEKT
jgi:hypothetical protein